MNVDLRIQSTFMQNAQFLSYNQKIQKSPLFTNFLLIAYKFFLGKIQSRKLQIRVQRPKKHKGTKYQTPPKLSPKKYNLAGRKYGREESSHVVRMRLPLVPKTKTTSV